MQYLTIMSNYIYLFCGLFLLYKKKYLYGVVALLLWLISHIYHSDCSDNLWGWKMNADILFASIAFIIVLFNCHPVLLCVKNIILLFLLLALFVLGYYYYYIDINIYYVYHSLWHICSALFILYLILNHHEDFN